MTAIAPRRSLNELVTRYWTMMSKVYNFPFVQRHIYRPAQDDTIAQLREHNSQRIVDIACGTGILASRIQAELSPASVFGVDMSDGMLAKARARSTDVQWKKAPAEQLPFGDATLDAVVTTSAFHFFDQPAALAEFYRVLAPGGLASVATICPKERRWLGRGTGERRPAHFPTAGEMERLFSGAGFDVVVHRPVARPITPPLISVDWICVGLKT
ncbi:class I SAM-dependent methyltransferase [Mycobacteroides salmoniphilum]|uniref:23S rRNA (Guanine(745)-N(1))-methyltransferase n=1 Tax=Mycobacteroides salmoniphilum TaxID=404941 RepID=A0A4R8ST07_9MYCO|nr:methyltransferase domain-containing protein [Mycobacteroides salmoniphilum]TDZ94110.1 23S rRNA (guanine(745)-N(1))-methyltransferase [Mycobacteroides salmoniphilum]TEA03575.1 23S rRNA (guanine(745)-N(1))-methyltransferase [Mycobacteroides salmoniphilum]